VRHANAVKARSRAAQITRMQWSDLGTIAAEHGAVMWKLWCLLFFAAACAADPADGDVTGPFTGPTRHYAVDRIDVPMTNTQARELGGDLNGDRVVDNQLGMIISTLITMGDGTKHGADMIAAGAIASSVDVVADDLSNDETVSVVFHGSDGDAAVPVGGTLRGGSFVSNASITTSHPGRAIAQLPVFVDADPSTVAITHLEISMTPDGKGGFDADLHGLVDADAAIHEAYTRSVQMIAANPSDHISFMALMDEAPHDWVMSSAEFTKNELIRSLFSPDIERDGVELLSLGFRVHLVPCDGGCTLPAPDDHCHDRVIDQDETGVDCGGATCSARCAGAQPCSGDTDCQSLKCNAGICAASSCVDGVKDGFESEIDCGANCDGCQLGEHCYDDNDCPLGSSCGPRCTDTLCYPHLDTCE
jgi:hypothetical protein